MSEGCERAGEVDTKPTTRKASRVVVVVVVESSKAVCTKGYLRHFIL